MFSLFQWPLRHALVPIFAAKVLRVGADGYGFLLAASGMGALLGAVAVACLGDFKNKAWLCIGAAVAAGIAACAFSLSPWYSLSLGIMGFVGLAEVTGSITSTTLLMLVTPNEMRGRVMSLREAIRGVVGSFVAYGLGLGGEYLGVVTTSMLLGTFIMLCVFAMYLFLPAFRKL